MKKRPWIIILIGVLLLFAHNSKLYAEETWSFDKIEIVTEDICRVNSYIVISPQISGEKEGLNYKYVWMKDNWKSWGIIKEFSTSQEVEWNPSESGDYKIYVDVKDEMGQIITKSTAISVTSQNYQMSGISTSAAAVQKVNSNIELIAETTGDTDGLEYKFVWMKNSWAKWGVIKEFNAVNSVKWNPSEAGDYKIYLDIRDKEGNIKTYTRNFEIKDYVWSFEAIEFDQASPVEKKALPVTITAKADGDDGLQYKFVWMKDNWKEWGVIQDFGTENRVTWSPVDTGNYKIYVDVKDASGNSVTRQADFLITKNHWKCEGIQISPEGAQVVGQEIEIQALIDGAADELQYKFVWMKDNWKEWGVIREFSDENCAVWEMPKKTGTYKIYVDVMDKDGEKSTVSTEYLCVPEASWKLEEILIENNSTIPVGETIHISANISGDTDGIKLKYVWMKDSWSSWGVLQAFDTNKEIEWTPGEPGKYYLYLDIMDANGEIYDPVIKEINVYEFTGVKLSSVLFEKGKQICISPQINGSSTGAEFKYVWAKAGWAKWGVIQDFAQDNSVTWTPEEVGEYKIYIDMKVDGQEIVTKQISINVKEGILAKIDEIKTTYLTVPYKYGGNTPQGWDCSGFTQWSLAQMGVSIPRSSSMQSQGGKAIDPIDVSKWQPGDVICYAERSGRISHVALYIGDGKLMHALNSRVGTVIHGVEQYEKLDTANARVTVRRYI